MSILIIWRAFEREEHGRSWWRQRRQSHQSSGRRPRRQSAWGASPRLGHIWGHDMWTMNRLCHFQRRQVATQVCRETSRSSSTDGKVIPGQVSQLTVFTRGAGNLTSSLPKTRIGSKLGLSCLCNCQYSSLMGAEGTICFSSFWCFVFESKIICTPLIDTRYSSTLP